ncbi:glycosyltransferase [Acetobacter sp. AN02]|uniref:glycosyltransferase n=1 Tax=Acetobacter sp. AN02 TaxID=2894186 RepID=UPI0024345086|nr:glycosyltransferase [Acetobacter sp. AN02]MDG6095169.1 glycosyltransferase [Acetobacter sp. AN02]
MTRDTDSSSASSGRAGGGWRPEILAGGKGAGERHPPVTILLSVCNGEAFLNRQLDSFLDQSLKGWSVLWRDDGSSDASYSIMQSFQMHRGAGRCEEAEDPASVRFSQERMGIFASYLHLLSQAPEGGMIAFSDQDDVWLTDKLARGAAALARVPEGVPGLYCARQTLTDRHLTPFGVSPELPEHPDLLAALTGNIATGCTVMLNDAARRLLLRHEPPPLILHDWWAYLLVSAAGGQVLTDQQPVVLYRQHGGNAVGAPPSFFRRALSALRRGPRRFMQVFRSNLSWLMRIEELSAETRNMLGAILRAANGPRMLRLWIFRRWPGLRRLYRAENLLFRLWILLG